MKCEACYEASTAENPVTLQEIGTSLLSGLPLLEYLHESCAEAQSTERQVFEEQMDAAGYDTRPFMAR